MAQPNISVKSPVRSLSDYARKYLGCLERRRPQLEALLCRIGFSREDSLDAAQEAIIEAAKLIEDEAVEGLCDRWAWLRTVAVNKARSIRRSRWTGWVPLDPDALPEALVFDPFADEGDLPALLDALRSAIDRLPTRLKDLVVYCYLKEHTYAEAAEWFQVSRRAVNGRLFRVRELLRSELESLPEFRARATVSDESC